MLGIYVTVPIACFRKGLAREYLETEILPPPATCYGFLLSLVGETKRARHVGCRVVPTLLNETAQSVVLRTVWRVKKMPLGSPGNTRPDYQQLLTGKTEKSPFIELLIWLDSTDEPASRLEDRVRIALGKDTRHQIERFGGLSLGESTHLVDEVSIFEGDLAEKHLDRKGRAFLLADRGRYTFPVWVDHVGSAKTRYVTGDLVEMPAAEPPDPRKMPKIQPHAS
jgi:CRISPR-associated protein Cas5t